MNKINYSILYGNLLAARVQLVMESIHIHSVGHSCSVRTDRVSQEPLDKFRWCIELGRGQLGVGCCGKSESTLITNWQGEGLEWGEQVYSVVVRVIYVHVGIPIYLGNTKESEVAEGSTATVLATRGI